MIDFIFIIFCYFIKRTPYIFYLNNTTQNYFNLQSFFSRSAVLRGRVITETGRGLVGVRVTHADLHTEGYTMTQEDGWFDFMVNGGGAITLKFGKSPFPAQIRTLFAPWNEVGNLVYLIQLFYFV